MYNLAIFSSFEKLHKKLKRHEINGRLFNARYLITDEKFTHTLNLGDFNKLEIFPFALINASRYFRVIRYYKRLSGTFVLIDQIISIIEKIA